MARWGSPPWRSRRVYRETCNDFLCTYDTAGPNQVIVADFNGDTKADIATANTGYTCSLICIRGPGGVSVLLGNGNGTFQTPKLAMSNATVTSIDADNSGDIVAANWASNSVSVLKSNGDGTFSSGGSLATGTNPSAVTSKDLDEDGIEDLAVSNFASDNLSVLWGNSSGGFQSAQNFAAGDGPAFVIGARLNDDGFADLAVANQNSNNVSVLLNTPRPDINAPITTRSLSPQPNAAGWNREDVTVTLNATDDDSGVKEISYPINGGQLTTVQQSSVQIPPSPTRARRPSPTPPPTTRATSRHSRPSR